MENVNYICGKTIDGNQLPRLHEKEELFPTKLDLINSL